VKEKIIYIVVFFAAFAVTSGGILYMNSHYRDIFKLDFTPINTSPDDYSDQNNSGAAAISRQDFTEFKTFMQREFKNEIFDSLRALYTKSKKIDTVYAKTAKDTSLLDSLSNLSRVLKDTKERVAFNQKKLSEIETEKHKSIAMQDSSYLEWTKETAKMYESMDPKKAAKIIQSYSDNVARDILYTMRQKKAADILAELNPQTANRITRAK
jgi:flagellar motility protein MotE (MotC chaperone)